MHYDNIYSAEFTKNKNNTLKVQAYFNDIDFSAFNPNSKNEFVFVSNHNDHVEKNTVAWYEQSKQNNYYVTKSNFYKFLYDVKEDNNIPFETKDYVWFFSHQRTLTNSDINLIKANLNVLNKLNKNNSLLLKAKSTIKILQSDEVIFYNHLVTSMANNKYIELDFLVELKEMLVLEYANDIKKTIIPIKELFTISQVDLYITKITKFDEKFKNKTFINAKIKQFQIDTMTFSNVKNKCYSHTLIQLKPHFDEDMNVLFKSEAIDTNIINCSLI